MKLSRRESVFGAAGLALALLIGAEEWLFRPLWLRRQEVVDRTERSERQLRTMKTLFDRSRRYSVLLKNVEGRLIREGDKFSLFAFLEEAAGKIGIRERLVAMNPSESSGNDSYRRLEMLVRFEDLSMEQAVEYLKRLSDAPRLIRVSRLTLERSSRQPGKIGLTASVVAFAVKEPPARPR